jgi:predicted Zn-dependent protease
MLMARVHARHKRTAESAREALKRLKTKDNENDWLCNCIIAQELLRKGEIDDAKVHLERVASVDKAISKPNLGMILHAIELRTMAGLDCDELRGFIVGRVLPNFRNANLEEVRPDGKIQIIYTYISAALNVPESSLESVLQYWAIASRLSDQLVPGAVEEKNVACLKQFGALQLDMQNCVARFAKAGRIDSAQAEQMNREIDARGLAAWTAVRDLRPDDPAGYAGRGGYLIKSKQFNEAEADVVAGIQTAGPHPELLRLLIILDERNGRSQRALDFALVVARKNPDYPNAWRVLIDAAKLANRRDIAITACQEMRRAKPGLTFPDMAEGILWLESGDAHKALECLNRVEEKFRVSEPAVTHAYAKALVNAGHAVRVPDYVNAVIANADLKKLPQAAFACLQGVADAEPSLERADQLVQWLDRLLATWPSVREVAVEAKWLRGEAMYRAAELASPRWEPARLERAFRAFEELKFEFPNDPRAPYRLMQLALHGRKDTAAALTFATTIADRDDLAVDVRNAIGATFVENRQYGKAIAQLEPILKSPKLTGYTLTLLARAYQGQGDGVRAKQTLTRASGHKMSDREREEYVAAATAIIRESP